MKRWYSLLLSLVVLGACMDPVASDEEDALGPEVDGIREGPRHRAGQPCLVCHGDHRSTGPIMVAGGTIYIKKDQGNVGPAAGAEVILEQVAPAPRKSVTRITNDVGNFLITQEEWPDPVYPLKVSVNYQGDGFKWKAQMVTKVGRVADCNKCHQGKGDPSHAQATYAEQQQGGAL